MLNEVSSRAPVRRRPVCGVPPSGHPNIGRGNVTRFQGLGTEQFDIPVHFEPFARTVVAREPTPLMPKPSARAEKYRGTHLGNLFPSDHARMNDPNPPTAVRQGIRVLVGHFEPTRRHAAAAWQYESDGFALCVQVVRHGSSLVPLVAGG